MLKFCNEKERNLKGARWGVSKSLELSCCQARAEGMAALHAGSWSSTATDCWLQWVLQGKAGKWGKMLTAASALRESNMVPFILVLVIKVFKTNKNTQLPPTISPWRICQEIAFSPLAEEPSQESTAGFKWLGHTEHLAIPVLDWKSDSCSTS